VVAHITLKTGAIIKHSRELDFSRPRSFEHVKRPLKKPKGGEAQSTSKPNHLVYRGAPAGVEGRPVTFCAASPAAVWDLVWPGVGLPPLKGIPDPMSIYGNSWFITSILLPCPLSKEFLTLCPYMVIAGS
jgi:hypothetical protein